VLIVLLTMWMRFDGNPLPHIEGVPQYWSLYLLYGAFAALVVAVPAWDARVRKACGTPTTLLSIAVLWFSFNSPSFLLRRVIAPATVPVLLLSTALAPASLFSRLLEFAPLRWIGRLSYSLYLWQQLFLVERDTPYPFALDGRRHPGMALLAAIALACASRYLVEKPCIRLGRAVAGR
jgi:peptidoglycan/LPS O-acetylase OafA/YrhL